MDPRVITSRRHPVVAAVTVLHRPSGRRAADALLAEGPHLVAEALAAGLRPLAGFATAAAFPDPASAAGALRAALQGVAPDAARPAGFWLVAPPVLAAMAETVHPQGVLGVFSLPARAAGAHPATILALDGVQDPGNVGALARALLAFAGPGSGLWCGAGTADPYGGKALRASAGAVFRLRVAAPPDLPAALGDRAAAGAEVWALVPRGGTAPPAGGLSEPLVLVVGAEGQGVSDAVRALCRPLTIPMAGASESLNAAQAGTVALYAAGAGRRGVDGAPPVRS